MSGFAVTVVIPLYNKAAYIRRTLESAIAQTHPAAEIIIVDDSSTDGSVAAIEDLVSGRVKLIRQANAGPGPARNRGIAEAISERVAFLDADDLWLPNHLATLAEVAAAFPQADVVAAGFRRLGADQPLPEIDRGPAAAHSLDYLRAARGGEALCTSALAVRRCAVEAAGGFGKPFPGEDIDLWVRLALDRPMAASPRVTSLYLQQTGGLMDRIGESAPTVPPMVATIDAALADPRHSPRHPDLAALRDHYLVNAIKQELYRGDSRAARRLIADCARIGAAVPASYRLLALLPRQLAQVAIRTAVALR